MIKFRLLCICGGWLYWEYVTTLPSFEDFDPYSNKGIVKSELQVRFEHPSTPSEFCIPYREAVVSIMRKEETDRFKQVTKSFEETLSHNLHG